MSSFQITGAIYRIEETVQVNDKFKKREFVLKMDEEVNGNVYSQYVKFQTTQNKCEILDNYAEGQEVTVSFNVKGNKWERDGKENFITNLDAWKLESTGTNPTGNGVPLADNNDYDPNDPLPF